MATEFSNETREVPDLPDPYFPELETGLWRGAERRAMISPGAASLMETCLNRPSWSNEL